MNINIKEELRKLVELQEIDSKIYELKQKIEVVNPGLLDSIKSEFLDKKKVLEEFENNVKNTQVKKKEKELDLAAKEESITKSQAQLYQLKTNKEYQAKLTEIESLKADISRIEEEVLKIFEEIEQAEAKLNEEKEKIVEYEKEFKEKETKILNEQKEIETEIKILEDKRGKISRDIDKIILSKYEQLIDTRNGVALAPVKNESCGACFLRTNHQTINEIKMYKDLVLCGNCVRILYIPEDLEG